MNKLTPAVFFLACALQAQLYSGIIASNRAPTYGSTSAWEHAGATITEYSHACTTAEGGGVLTIPLVAIGTRGSPASAANWNTVIGNCVASNPSGSYIQWAAGTSYLSDSISLIDRHNIILRGMGANSTFIIWINPTQVTNGICSTAMICVSPNLYGDPTAAHPSTNWTANYSQGTFTIAVASATGLSNGIWVALDQIDTGGGAGADNGGYWVCGQNADTGSNGAGSCCSSCASGVGRNNRGQAYFTWVTGVSGTNITLKDPLIHTNWCYDGGSCTTSQPQLWTLNASAVMVHDVGIENFSFDGSSAGSVTVFGTVFQGAYNCWFTGNRVIILNINVATRSQVRIKASSHITVRNNYFYGKGGGTGNYGTETYMGTNSLVENNIGECNSTAVNDQQAGSVNSYNYVFNNCYTNPNWLQPGHYYHSPGNTLTLMEGDDTSGVIYDIIHGPADFMMAYRVRWTGWEPGRYNGSTQAVHNYANSRYNSTIASVLGTLHYHSTYESYPASGWSACATSVFALGDGANCTAGGSSGNPSDDPLVRSTGMRWGNYDVANAGLRWVSGEVPSGISGYPNSVPSTICTASSPGTCPPSFYLSSKPSWWSTAYGSAPWPPIGPDVTGGNLTDGGGGTLGGYANKIPARICYENLPLDMNYDSSSFTITGATWNATGGGFGQPIITLTVNNSIPNPVPNVTSQTTFHLSGMTNTSGPSLNGDWIVYSTTSTTVSFGYLVTPGTIGFGSAVFTWPNIRQFDAGSSLCNYGAVASNPALPPAVGTSNGSQAGNFAH